MPYKQQFLVVGTDINGAMVEKYVQATNKAHAIEVAKDTYPDVVWNFSKRSCGCG